MNLHAKYNEKGYEYACRLIRLICGSKINSLNVEKCINYIRSKVCIYFQLAKDDMVWDKEFLSYIREYVIFYNQKNIQQNVSVLNLTKKTYSVKKLRLEKKIQEINKNRESAKKNKLEFQKMIVKIDSHLSMIINESNNYYSMTRSLMNYMFPNLFEDDQRHLFYRYNVQGFCPLSEKKISLIKLLIKKKFSINENDWLNITKYINIICATPKHNKVIFLGVSPHLKLKKPCDIFPNENFRNVDTLKELVANSFSMVDLTEKLTKATFYNLFKNRTSNKYQCYAKDNFMGLNQTKLINMFGYIKLAVDCDDYNVFFNACIYTINKYLLKSKKVIGDNILSCLMISRGEL
ncbi:36R protein [Yaba-like disease virus]|uniref:36R protein n=1 Tax=Yaba-like disease virus TaxID=132475 RepID=Q9DHS6_YLDV|nr:36R protein [Yaba-like disease virus]CAC21274.1 36R protein [Yaba-like disease virus]